MKISPFLFSDSVSNADRWWEVISPYSTSSFSPGVRFLPSGPCITYSSGDAIDLSRLLLSPMTQSPLCKPLWLSSGTGVSLSFHQITHLFRLGPHLLESASRLPLSDSLALSPSLTCKWTRCKERQNISCACKKPLLFPSPAHKSGHFTLSVLLLVPLPLSIYHNWPVPLSGHSHLSLVSYRSHILYSHTAVTGECLQYPIFYLIHLSYRIEYCIHWVSINTYRTLTDCSPCNDTEASLAGRVLARESHASAHTISGTVDYGRRSIMNILR